MIFGEECCRVYYSYSKFMVLLSNNGLVYFS